MEPFLVVQALWLFVPAYFANMAPVFAAKAFPTWKARIDGGHLWKRDGRALLGEGKTWRGLWAGVLVGGILATLQSLGRDAEWDLSDFGRASAGGSLLVPLAIGVAMGLGAGAGDSVKSFFKRRTGRAGGRPWVPFDQLDFVVGGLAFGAVAALALAATGATRANWFVDEFLGPRWPVLLILLVVTPLLHFVVNVIGYKLRLKRVPW